jgi:hypothetical protein
MSLKGRCDLVAASPCTPTVRVIPIAVAPGLGSSHLAKPYRPAFGVLSGAGVVLEQEFWSKHEVSIRDFASQA